MREIKFRAWDESRNQMIYEFGTIAEDKPQLMTYEDNRFLCGHYQPNGDWIEPKLMQYTGLKDKNGKEIYEADIVSCQDKNGVQIGTPDVVQWSNGRACWWLRYRDIALSKWDLIVEEGDLEVLGDKYSNPGLVNQIPSTIP